LRSPPPDPIKPKSVLGRRADDELHESGRIGASWKLGARHRSVDNRERLFEVGGEEAVACSSDLG
jgi:hypothetical protein